MYNDGKDQSGPLTLGGNLADKERVIYTPNVSMNLSRTEAMLALIAPMYPIAGAMLSTIAVLNERFIRDDIGLLGHSSKKLDSDSWAKRGEALEIVDQVGEAATAYSKSLQANPKNYVAQRGIMKCINRVRTDRRISDHINHPLARNSIKEFQKLTNNPFIGVIHSNDAINPFVRARRSNDEILSQNDILCIAIRSFFYKDLSETRTFDGLTEKGLAHSRIDDYPLAVEFFDKALSLRPDHMKTLQRIGLSFYNMQNFSKAVEYLSQLVKVDPGHANGWAHLGISLLFTGRFEESESALRRSLELNSRHEMALINLTSLLIQIKKCDEALEMLNEVKKLFPYEVWGVLEEMMTANCIE
jgi:tetratricopeptide (TPR) repeat protein